MKRFLMLILCFSFVGCASLKTLKPIAIQNQENIKNYIENNHRIYTITKKLIVLRLDIELGKVRQYVESDLIKGYGDPLDEKKLNSEAQKIKEVLQAINLLSTKIDEASQSQLDSKKQELETLKRIHPVAYDVAIGKFTEETASLDNEQINNVFNNYTDDKMQLRMVNPLLDKYTTVADFIKTRQALIDAYEKYLNTLLEQGRIAIRHAEALVFFTQEEFDVGNTILQTIGNVEVQKSILEIIRDVSGEERSAKAKEILESLFSNNEGNQQH